MWGLWGVEDKSTFGAEAASLSGPEGYYRYLQVFVGASGVGPSIVDRVPQALAIGEP
jgi:hypothetical protein